MGNMTINITWACGGLPFLSSFFNFSSTSPLLSTRLRESLVLLNLNYAESTVSVCKSWVWDWLFSLFWPVIFILYFLDESVNCILNSVFIWQIRNTLQALLQAVPVKTSEINGLRDSFPPQSSVGYKGMCMIHYLPALLMHWSFIADCWVEVVSTIPL